MKVVAINGSPRPQGNTALLLKRVLEVLQQEGIETEMVQMIVPGSSYWNIAVGRQPGEVEHDEEGMRTMTVLGENMAWLLRQLNRSDFHPGSPPESATTAH